MHEETHALLRRILDKSPYADGFIVEAIEAHAQKMQEDPPSEHIGRMASETLAVIEAFQAN